MSRIVLALGLGMLGMLAAACNGGGGGGGGGTTHANQTEFPDKGSLDIGTSLATINKMEVGTNDFDRVAKRMRPRAGAITDEFKTEVMDELVNETLLYQEALRQGIDRDPKIRKMMVNTLLKKDVYGTLDPDSITEEELKAYFEEHKEDFVVPEKVQIKRILLKVTDSRPREEARTLAADLQEQIASNPTSFKALAQEHSQGPYARRGGDLGFVGQKGKPGIDQILIDAAFEMDKGDVSDVVETDDGFNILYVPNRRERVERTFEQMRGSVLRKVKSDRYNELYDAYVGRLESDAKIVKDDVAVDAYEYKVDERTGPVPGPVRMTTPGDAMDQARVPAPGTDEARVPAPATER
jgi:peptidyl-prolyl cis-trans isomerase C